MRDKVLSEIAAIVPLDSLEAGHIGDAQSWIESGAEICRICKPATPPKHLVSYFALVDDGHILLVDHKNARLWLPTGGHVEPGEHPRETVRRELLEELGLEAPDAIDPPVMITCTETVGVTAGHTDVSLWYAIQVKRDVHLSIDRQEFNEARWFRFADVPLSRSDPHMARFLRKLRMSCGLGG